MTDIQEKAQLTYAEQRNERPFDWNGFLATDRTPTEWEEASELASGWITCACGNQCAVLPRNHHGAPYDVELFRHGWTFMDCIDTENVDAAKATLAKIEQRSTYLLTCPNYTAPDEH